MINSAVYEAEIAAMLQDNLIEKNNYIGLFEGDFKIHHPCFQHIDKSNETKLVTHVQSLKRNSTSYTIKWRIIEKPKRYVNGCKKCNLCITEISHILRTKNSTTLLNSRSAIFSRCKHMDRFLLSN